MKKNARIVIIGLLLTILFLFSENYIVPAKFIHLKIYDIFNRIEYILRKPPHQIDDIVLVSIDNETISKMPHRWPYPRSVFADVIKNLTLAQAKVIAFDFVFLGKSEEKEDEALKIAMENNNKIILAGTIDENGSLSIRSLPSLSTNVAAGIVTKFQDMDGVIRKALTYLISGDIPPKGFLSWGLTIIKKVEGLNIIPVKSDACSLLMKNDRSEQWIVPVDCSDKSFIINFRAHTGDFKHVSFYSAYRGDFDPEMVKDKILLVGFVSSLLGDIHNTPIGWMPGVTLNANALLTLYTRAFIRPISPGVERVLTVIGVILSILVLLLFDIRTSAIVISSEIIIFFILSYMLLTWGYVWDYFIFPFSVAAFPALSKKIYSWIWQRKKFYWT